MKSLFEKLKNMTRGVTFFWRTLIIIFFVSLIIVSIGCAIFWINVEQGLDSPVIEGGVKKSKTFSADSLNQVLEKIKARSIESASTTDGSTNLIDPSL